MSSARGAKKVVKRGWRLWQVLLGWVLSRAAMTALWLLAEPAVGGDVEYYWLRMDRMIGDGIPAAVTMVEYPTPTLWVLHLLYLFSGGTNLGFRIAFAAVVALLDLGFTLVLFQRGRGRVAAWFWIAFGLAVGPIMYFRLDLMPSLLCAAALISAWKKRDAIGGGLLAFGTGLKLWPVVLWPVLLRGDRKRDVKMTAAFAGSGILIVLAALVYAGWSRLISPLAWQAGRGLQIESLWATPVMLARAFGAPGFSVRYSQWQAYEIFGPGVPWLLMAASLAAYAGYLLIFAAYVFWVRQSYSRLFSLRPSLETSGKQAASWAVGMLAVTIVTIILITSKTFSPQYFIWLGAPLAATLMLAAVDEAPKAIAKTLRTAAVWVLFLAVATQLIYPLLYDGLIDRGGNLPLATGVLAVRNVALLVFVGWLVVRFWPVLRRSGFSPTPTPTPTDAAS